MRLLVASPQRCGTYLTAAVMVRRFGLQMSWVHIGANGIAHHRFLSRRIDRETLVTEHSLEPPVIEDGTVSVTHAGPDVIDLKAFDYKVYVKREFRQALVSRFTWYRSLGRHDIANFREWLQMHGCDGVRDLKQMEAWASLANEVIHYEDLIKDPANLALETPTNSRGATPKWQDIWSPEIEASYQHYWSES